MRFKNGMIVAIFFSVLGLSCGPTLPPSGMTYKEIPLRITGFMSDCFAGDINGVSASHVNYTVSIVVYEGAGGAEIARYPDLPSSLGPDKSVFMTTIKIPSNVGFKIIATVDATQCSACNQSWCNNYNVNENGITYTVSAGKPYWSYNNTFGVYSGSFLEIKPDRSPRSPSGNPPEICDCKIKR